MTADLTVQTINNIRTRYLPEWATCPRCALLWPVPHPPNIAAPDLLDFTCPICLHAEIAAHQRTLAKFAALAQQLNDLFEAHRHDHDCHEERYKGFLDIAFDLRDILAAPAMSPSCITTTR